MSLSYERNTDLAFDTNVLKNCADQYEQVAEKLRAMATKLDNALLELSQSGWTTPAGTAFHKMTQTSWKDNIEKYAALLDTLKKILYEGNSQYENLVSNYIETTKL